MLNALFRAQVWKWMAELLSGYDLLRRARGDVIEPGVNVKNVCESKFAISHRDVAWACPSVTRSFFRQSEYLKSYIAAFFPLFNTGLIQLYHKTL